MRLPVIKAAIAKGIARIKLVNSAKRPVNNATIVNLDIFHIHSSLLCCYFIASILNETWTPLNILSRVTTTQVCGLRVYM